MEENKCPQCSNIYDEAAFDDAEYFCPICGYDFEFEKAQKKSGIENIDKIKKNTDSITKKILHDYDGSKSAVFGSGILWFILSIVLVTVHMPLGLIIVLSILSFAFQVGFFLAIGFTIANYKLIKVAINMEVLEHKIEILKNEIIELKKH